jgi:rhomboid protease GluP
MFYNKIILRKGEFLMNSITITEKDEIIMRLVHYFITKENYTPIVVRGVKDEVWLENTDAYYKIVRINSNYIHNIEQFNMDILKVTNVVRQVKRKTFSFSMKVLNIFLDMNEDVKTYNSKNIFSVILKNGTSDEDIKKLATYFPTIENNIMNNDEGIDLILNITEDINDKTANNNRIYEATFKPKKIIITYIIMAICIILFVLMYILGNGSMDTYTLYSFGAVYKKAILNGQIYRLLTGTLLHAGLIHLLCNMYSLYIIGSQLENFVGKAKFLVIYLVSAISGSLLSCIFSSSISVGASGAIFGLLGSLLYFGYHYRLYLGSVVKTQIIPLIILNLFLGFMSTGIDNFAHIGGLIGGFLATMALGINGKSTKSERINGSIVLIIYLIFLIFMLFR